MTTYVLVVFIVLGHNGGPVTVPGFKTAASCIEAGETFMRQKVEIDWMADPYFAEFMCVPVIM